GITSIGANAFEWCANLESVTLPESLTEICGSAFLGCENLKEIRLPKNLTSIGPEAFKDCRALKSITIPENVANIGAHAFENCVNLTEINYNAIKCGEIRHAFKCAGKNTDGIAVTIGDKVRELPDGLFSAAEVPYYLYDESIYDVSDYVAYVKSVNFAEGCVCERIGEDAFRACLTLETITLPNSLLTIERDAFNRCKNLKKITIPKSVKNVGFMAFYKCEKLNEVVIEGRLEEMGKRVFEDCTQLKSITAPEGLPNPAGDELSKI
ncbi:MAG: leucine-rich repeat domain-containing protein, partial [Clostridia bacterium]|nr:leucine-rich repeat domain-containing protein [Clostridia bacterium]